MKDGATLGQIQKILSFLEGVPSGQVQDVIEFGLLSSVIRNGDLQMLAKETETKKIRHIWRVIGILTGFKNISITVPHVRYQYANSEENGFQLRCWLGEHGHVNTPGHVDSGTARGTMLFQIYIGEALRQCPCCWPDDLRNVGIETGSNATGSDPNKKWVLKDLGSYDILTYETY